MDKLSMPKNRGARFALLRIVAKMLRLYRPKGAGRLLYTIYPPHQRHQDYIDIVIDYDRHLFIRVNTASLIEWNLFFFGYYEVEITNIIRRLFRPGFVALDVGANIGCHTLVMGHAAQAEGKILAIEPHPIVLEKLTENIRLNRLKNIKPIPCALSDTPGIQTIYSASTRYHNQGEASLYAENTATTNQYQVEVKTLDALVQEEDLKRLDFIKIDTQGSEIPILSEARQSIETFLPYIVFEYSWHHWQGAKTSMVSCQRFFDELGYLLYTIKPGFLEKVGHRLLDDANVLAVPPLRKE